jgi:hypothetical protein
LVNTPTDHLNLIPYSKPCLNLLVIRQ